MIKELSQEIRKLLASFSPEDQILFNNKLIKTDPLNFKEIKSSQESKTIAFIDGGQAEILSAGNFCLSFIRVFALVMKENKKFKTYKNEFYLFTKAKYENQDLFYESKIFPLNEKLFEESTLFISSNDSSIRTGTERAPITKITNIARRFAELALASKVQADYTLLDGTLQPSFKNEEKLLAQLPKNTSALAKTSNLFTISSNSPAVLLAQLSPFSCWSYFLQNQTYFVKLHKAAKHVFRFEGNPEILLYLIPNSQDPLFLGYPYGLILADQFARISNQEKNSLKTKFLLDKENQAILKYLNSTNAHEILDNLS